MERVLIVGNSGSGKSTYAKERAAADVVADLDAFVARHAAWVIEGELLFLNPGVAACVANNRRRPWEPHKFASAADQDRMLPNLLAWVESYYTRTDPRSYAFHRRLFAAYAGNKRELS